jgi:hypothetical protein
MVLIAQAFFDVMNLHKFKRSMCPQTGVGSTMGLHLSLIVCTSSLAEVVQNSSTSEGQREHHRLG